MQVIAELELCDDCVYYFETGEHLEDTNEEREREVAYAVSRLPGLVNDTYDEPHATCDTCGWDGDEALLANVYTDPEYPDWTEKGCPSCYETEEITRKDTGRDEFSWSECDCCGSRLGGSRTRYAQLGPDDEVPQLALPLTTSP